jgi:hypothetical protein
MKEKNKKNIEKKSWKHIWNAKVDSETCNNQKVLTSKQLQPTWQARVPIAKKENHHE